jgi:hypothetical protein
VGSIGVCAVAAWSHASRSSRLNSNFPVPGVRWISRAVVVDRADREAAVQGGLLPHGQVRAVRPWRGRPSGSAARGRQPACGDRLIARTALADAGVGLVGCCPATARA